MSLLTKCQTTIIKSCNRDLARGKGLWCPASPPFLPAPHFCQPLTRPPAPAASPTSCSLPASSAGAGSWCWRLAVLSRPPPPPAPPCPRGCRDKDTQRDDTKTGLLGKEQPSHSPSRDGTRQGQAEVDPQQWGLQSPGSGLPRLHPSLPGKGRDLQLYLWASSRASSTWWLQFVGC